RAVFPLARAVFPLASAVLCLTGAIEAQIPQPPTERVDTDRSVEKQRNAARTARERVQQGPGDVSEVIALLGDRSGTVRDQVFGQIVEQWSVEQRRTLRVGFGRQGVKNPVAKNPVAKNPVAKNPVANGLDEILAEIFLHQPDAELKRELLSVVTRSRSADAREMALGALAALPISAHDKNSIEVVAQQAKRGSPWFVQGEALRTLAIIDGEGAEPLLRRRLKEKKVPALRIAALQGLVVVDLGRGCAAAYEEVTDPWKDRQGIWGERIRRAGLEILALEGRKLPRDRRALIIDGLISSSATMEGSTLAKLWSTLPLITEISAQAAPIRSSFSSWDSWWKANRNSWVEGSAASEKTGASDPTEDREDSDGGTRVIRYHGVPLDSNRIVFLSDVSGGMSRTVDGRFGRDGARRIDVARNELLRVLGELPREALVQVVHFGSQSIPALTRVQPLMRSRKTLENKIRSQEVPSGRGDARGNLYGPLRRAVLEAGTDTVMLLTEGAPTEGRVQQGDRLRWHIRRWNRWGQARIHVLSVGQIRGQNLEFLQGVARDGGGQFHDLDGSFGKAQTSP
ncbi:MAG: hypothetical protein OSB09_04075, partial [Planctomycetota bacterium]|nr:hypothetical protein [Planctomycetota bacterium]